ncbi:uncharacterized protein LOC8263589 isoform X2 [Ricinus communis]|uniref:uncharacterized protein LOC8263589 isoform X2 n=1 Tax=Ricinus communis TaxID=3988 RepID=UPI00201B0133|nr:uncharacterized protein LOC8263589 isoform X2 [Ricinus communis]
MANSISEIENKQDDDPEINKNLFLIFPKFEFKFLKFGNNLDPKVEKVLNKEKEKTGSNKPGDVVKFADPKPITPPPLKIENQEASKLSHPLVLLPVYALGGFIILKWVWARWKERKERAKQASSGDDQSSDEYQSPADDNE